MGVEGEEGAGHLVSVSVRVRVRVGVGVRVRVRRRREGRLPDRPGG